MTTNSSALTASKYPPGRQMEFADQMRPSVAAFSSWTYVSRYFGVSIAAIALAGAPPPNCAPPPQWPLQSGSVAGVCFVPPLASSSSA